jgi:hypothetical protein
VESLVADRRFVADRVISSKLHIREELMKAFAQAVIAEAVPLQVPQLRLRRSVFAKPISSEDLK